MKTANSDLINKQSCLVNRSMDALTHNITHVNITLVNAGMGRHAKPTGWVTDRLGKVAKGFDRFANVSHIVATCWMEFRYLDE